MRARTQLLAAAVTALACAGCAANGGAAPARPAAQPSPTAPPATTVQEIPLHAESVSPPKTLGPQTPIKVAFNRSPGHVTSTPTLSPAVAGTWATSGNDLVFTPAQAYSPGEVVTVSVPESLGGPLTAKLTAPAGSLLRAQQILAHLGYLPLQFVGTTPADAAAEAAAAYTPPTGTFQWRWANVPGTLAGRWQPGASGVMTQGAVMAFQNDNGLAMDGVLGPVTWQALLAADQANKTDPHPYSYIWADLTVPEHLWLWVDGRTVLESPVNGGVRGAPTPIGTWPIYERFTTTTMSGTNPDGTHYRDPGIPWVSYFNGGAAVHGFPRATYGWPQSVGCLELPISTAQQVYSLTGFGTLVTVYGNAFG